MKHYAIALGFAEKTANIASEKKKKYYEKSVTAIAAIIMNKVFKSVLKFVFSPILLIYVSSFLPCNVLMVHNPIFFHDDL